MRGVGERRSAPGKYLVGIALMRNVKDDLVARRIEDAVQRDGELNDSEVGGEVAANSSCVFEDGAANFVA